MATVKFKGSTYTYPVTLLDSITITPNNLTTLLTSIISTVETSPTRPASSGFTYRTIGITNGTFLIPTPGSFSVTKKYRINTGAARATAGGGSTTTFGEYLLTNQTFSKSGSGTYKLQSRIYDQNGDQFDSDKTTTLKISLSGFIPSATISPTITSNIHSQFGNVCGFCTGSVKLNSNGGSWNVPNKGTLSPPIISSSLSGNGKSTTTINGTLNLGKLNSTSISVTATVKNRLEGTKTTSITLTTQAYSKPTVSGLSLSRGANNYADIKFDYTLHGLNKTSNVTANITAGNATGYWKILDSNGNQVYPVSGWASSTIVSDGNTLANTSGTITGAISEELRSDQSYTLYAYVEDRLGETSQIMNYVLPTEYRTLDFLNGGKGAAFGKVSEYEGLDIAMDVFCKPLIGSVQMYAGATAPNGWFICDGAPKNTQDYPELFEILQYRYGGSGTTFNLPDIRGRMPVGAGQGSGLTNRPLAGKGGSEGIQQHEHTHDNPTVTSSGKITGGITGGSHHHSMTNFSSGSGSESAYMTTSNRSRTSRNTSSDTHTHDLPNHTHTLSGGGVGNVTNLPSGQTIGDSGNMSPYLGINFIIHAGRPTIQE